MLVGQQQLTEKSIPAEDFDSDALAGTEALITRHAAGRSYSSGCRDAKRAPMVTLEARSADGLYVLYCNHTGRFA